MIAFSLVTDSRGEYPSDLVYNQAVRCLFAILQLLLLSLPTLASTYSAAFHAQDRMEMSLPACCRRAGMHHCLLAARHEDASGQSGFRAEPQPCPFGPRALPAAQHAPASLVPSLMIFAEIVSHPACAAQTLAKRRIALDRARHKRGPPALA